MDTTTSSIPSSESQVLVELRIVAAKVPQHDIIGLRLIVERQAQLLRELLATPVEEILIGSLASMLGVDITVTADIPWSGTSFRRENRWHIHVRATDPVEMQTFTVLRQLKRIIDRPLRQEETNISDSEWESLATYFARQMLTH